MTSTTVVAKSTEKPPVRIVVRPRCPFYGFVGMGGIFMDNEGNACGVAGGHRPCAMEMERKAPDWTSCEHFNHVGNREQIEHTLDYCKIFPKELCPKGSPTWEGVSLRGWYSLVMRK